MSGRGRIERGKVRGKSVLWICPPCWRQVAQVTQPHIVCSRNTYKCVYTQCRKIFIHKLQPTIVKCLIMHTCTSYESSHIKFLSALTTIMSTPWILSCPHLGYYHMSLPLMLSSLCLEMLSCLLLGYYHVSGYYHLSALDAITSLVDTATTTHTNYTLLTNCIQIRQNRHRSITSQIHSNETPTSQ